MTYLEENQERLHSGFDHRHHSRHEIADDNFRDEDDAQLGATGRGNDS